MSITFSRATRVVSLCVNANLYASWEAAVASLEDVKKRASLDPRETDTSVRDAAAEITRIESEMLAHTIRFTLQAMRRKEWATFVAANPPREGDVIDRTFGVNVSELDTAIIAMTTDVLDPNGDPIEGFTMADNWRDLAEDMANPQWEPFANAVLILNQGEGSANVPFSQAASVAMRRSGQSSNSQSASE